MLKANPITLNEGDPVTVEFEDMEIETTYGGSLSIDFNYHSIGYILTRRLKDTSVSELLGQLNSDAPFGLLDKSRHEKEDFRLYPCETVSGRFPDFLRKLDKDEEGENGVSSGFALDHRSRNNLSVRKTFVDSQPRETLGMYEIFWKS